MWHNVIKTGENNYVLIMGYDRRTDSLDHPSFENHSLRITSVIKRHRNDNNSLRQ